MRVHTARIIRRAAPVARTAQREQRRPASSAAITASSRLRRALLAQQRVERRLAARPLPVVGERAVQQARQLRQRRAPSTAPPAQTRARSPRQPTCSRIQRSRYGLAVRHRSRSGSSSRPSPSMLSSVFCSSTSCGWTSMLKRREVWNRRSSTRPKEISFSGRSKIGSHTARIAASNSSTRVSGGHPAGLDVRLRDAPVVAAEEGEEVLREVVLVDLGERAHDAEVERDVAPVVGATKMLPGMHVGVEEAVAEHLGEEDLDAGARELRDVDALRAQRLDLARPACRACAPSPSRRCGSSPSAPRGTSSSGEPAKLRRSWLALAASRMRSSSSSRCLRELGHHLARLQPPAVAPTAARPAPAPVSSSARSLAMTARDARAAAPSPPPRVPSAACARCTCATEALATGSRSKLANTSSIGLP